MSVSSDPSNQSAKMSDKSRPKKIGTDICSNPLHHLIIDCHLCSQPVLYASLPRRDQVLLWHIHDLHVLLHPLSTEVLRIRPSQDRGCLPFTNAKQILRRCPKRLIYLWQSDEYSRLSSHLQETHTHLMFPSYTKPPLQRYPLPLEQF